MLVYYIIIIIIILLVLRYKPFQFWNFITAENKVVLNSYLVGIVVGPTKSIKTIYRVMWIIDFL